ncbi:MAG: dihydrofolate reductase family protein [Gemmatimonadetes bacterium]|nr:dihydrofolate reductase family protein [Gemmatimonadota bacterium]
MAKLVFGLNQSLDGFVDHTAFAPGPLLFRHFIEQVRGLAGSVYGRGMYEVMRYWDDDQADWGAAEREFAAAWRAQPKWVVSRSLRSVGPNATLVANDVEGVIRGLKERLVGEIDLSGPTLAHSIVNLGLIDEYRIYLHPVVAGGGTPFFAGPRPPLRLAASERMPEDVICLTYVPDSAGRDGTLAGTGSMIRAVVAEGRAFESWLDYQEALKRAVAPLTAEQLQQRALPGRRTPGEIAQHIVFGRALHLHRTLGDAAGSVAPYLRWDEARVPMPTAEEIVRGLEVTWQVIVACLTRGAPTDEVPAGDEARMRVVWGLLDHDLPHAGQLSLLLRAAGLPGVNLP